MISANQVPKLSVVVVSFNAPSILACCLASLEHQTPPGGVEILVVRNRKLTEPEIETLQRQFKKVCWIGVLPSYTVPQMRSLGIARSQGEIIALLEDDCVVTETWSTAIVEAHQGPYVAIGGAVEPGPYVKGLDWAVYFCEYVRFMLPLPQGDVSALAGNNVSYKRTMLTAVLKDIETRGFYDVFVHWQLKQAGQALKVDPAIIVHNVNAWKWSNLLNIPFHHGRGFAGMRLAQQPLWRRLPYLGLALLLPVVQVVRIIKQVTGRRRYILQLIQALPWIILFSISWSMGEFVGCLFGPGQSLEQWR